MFALIYITLFAQMPEDLLKSIGIKNVPRTQTQVQQGVSRPAVNLKDSIIIARQKEVSEIEKMYNSYRLALIGIHRDTILLDSTEVGGPRIRKVVTETLTLSLKQFGYNHFDWSSASFTEPGVMATDDYLLGPGDELTITLWGAMDQTSVLRVNPEGKVFLQGIGAIGVWGMRYGDVKERIKTLIKKTYANVNVDVTLTTLRKVNIFLTGELYAPGNYAISPLSSILYALYVAGGPTKNGSLRKIKVLKKSGETIYVDLYDYFVKGKPIKKIQFNDGDIIYVPPIGKTVAIGGSVKRPGIYELKEGESFKDLLDMCGGLLPEGYIGKIVIEGVKDHQRKIVLDKGFSSFKEFNNISRKIKPSDGDFIKISPVAKKRRNYVYVSGNVYYPGEFELTEKTTLRELLLKAKLKEDTYMERGEILRYASDSTYSIIPFNVDSVLRIPDYDTFKLAEWDSIIVFSKDAISPKKMVHLYGAVKNPGHYRLMPGMTVGDLLFAGIPLPTAKLDNAELLRRDLEKGEYKIITLDLTQKKDLDIPLQMGDNLIVKALRIVPNTVVITGEVRFPGKYVLRENETLKSLIERAGGFTPNAYIEGIVLERVSVKTQKMKAIRDLIFSAKKELLMNQSSLLSENVNTQEAQLKQAIFNQQMALINSLSKEAQSGRVALPVHKDISLDIPLEPGDSIYVPRIPATVQVIGAVYNPQGFLFKEGMKVKDVIEMAGGFTPDADRRGVYVLRASGESVKRVRKLKRGDTVIVPRKSPVQKTLFDTIKDFALIVYQIGVAVAAISSVMK